MQCIFFNILLSFTELPESGRNHYGKARLRKVVVMPIPETITLHIAASERVLLEKYGINVVMAAHDGITKDIKRHVYQEKQFLTKH